MMLICLDITRHSFFRRGKRLMWKSSLEPQVSNPDHSQVN